MTEYPGKHVFLHEEAPELYVAYNFYHKEIGRGTLEELVPIIRAHYIPVNRRLFTHPPTRVAAQPLPDIDIDLDF